MVGGYAKIASPEFVTQVGWTRTSSKASKMLKEFFHNCQICPSDFKFVLPSPIVVGRAGTCYNTEKGTAQVV